MPRPANIVRPIKLTLSIPEDIRAWLEVHLWSPAEGRVPHGAYTKLIQELLAEYKRSRENTHAPVPGNASEDSRMEAARRARGDDYP